MQRIASTDSAFDDIPGVTRVDPLSLPQRGSSTNTGMTRSVLR